jgi:hypothetical protein
LDTDTVVAILVNSKTGRIGLHAMAAPNIPGVGRMWQTWDLGAIEPVAPGGHLGKHIVVDVLFFNNLTDFIGFRPNRAGLQLPYKGPQVLLDVHNSQNPFVSVTHDNVLDVIDPLK